MRVVFAAADGRCGLLEEQRLDGTTERHLVALSPPPMTPGDPIAALRNGADLGLVIALAGGCPTRSELQLVARGLETGRRTWLDWPEEGALEVTTPERLDELPSPPRRQSALYRRIVAPIRHLHSRARCAHGHRSAGLPSSDMPGVVRSAASHAWSSRPARQRGFRPGCGAAAARRRYRAPDGPACAAAWPSLRDARQTAKPIAVSRATPGSTRSRYRASDQGCGVYFRTDFWAAHSSPVAAATGTPATSRRNLPRSPSPSRVSWRTAFRCSTNTGCTQIVMSRPSETTNEDDIVKGGRPLLRLSSSGTSNELRPAYIYERLVPR